MSQKLFSSEFWVPGAALSDYQIWFSKGEDQWIETTTASSLWSEYGHVIEKRKACQLTGWREKILARHMMMKNWFVIWTASSISGSPSGFVYKHKQVIWVCVLKRRPLICFFDFWYPTRVTLQLLFYCYLSWSRVLTNIHFPTSTKIYRD